MQDLISRQAVIEALGEEPEVWTDSDAEIAERNQWRMDVAAIKAVPSAQQERLTDDDFETIRIHLNACKEKLCNQRRWKEAEEYQRIIDRFMAFASTQPERKKGRWINRSLNVLYPEWERYTCSVCGKHSDSYDYCPNCGADMRQKEGSDDNRLNNT